MKKMLLLVILSFGIGSVALASEDGMRTNQPIVTKDVENVPKQMSEKPVIFRDDGTAGDKMIPRPPRGGSGAMMGNKTRPKPPMTGSGKIMPRLPRSGSGMVMGSGMMKPPMMNDDEMKGLGMALGKLTPEDRKELMTMIRNYLTSKGVTVPTPEMMKDKPKTGSGTSNEGKKEYVGHVTLMK